MADQLKDEVNAMMADAPVKPEPAPKPAKRKRGDPLPTQSTQDILLAMEREEQRGDEGAIKTGWETIDADMGKPIRPGEVVVIGARTGIGKTWVCQHLAIRAVVEDPTAAVVFGTFEMPGHDMGLRVAAHGLGLSPREVGLMAYQRLPVAEPVLGRIPQLDRIRWYDEGAAAEDLHDLIAGAARDLERQPNVLVLDYMGLLRWAGNRSAPIYERVSENFRAMKEVAKQSKVIILAATQLSRGGGRDGTVEPGLDALRDSGAAEEAADRILLFWRDAEGDGQGTDVGDEVRCKIAKNRHGGRGRCLLAFDHARRLSEVNEYELAVPDPVGNTDSDLPY